MASIDATLAAAMDTDTTTEEILLAATNHDVNVLKKLFRDNDAKVQDAETGYCPLHAAIASCEADDDLTDGAGVNGEGDAINGTALSEDSALATVQLLFENGAIWNELDANDETPGCMALRLGLSRVYEAVVAAGIRAELLFSKLDEYEPLPNDPEDAEDDDDAIVGFEPSPDVRNEPLPKNTNGVEGFEGFEPTPVPSYKVEEETQPGAQAGSSSQANGTHQSTQPQAEPVLANPNVNSEDYLKSELTYSGDRLLDSDKNAVMMDWETEIMKKSADKLCTKPGLRTMNVGFGMGIVDTMFLENSPAEHHIVEAHPQVIERMREKGWFEKPNVKIHQGRWQDVLPKLVEQGVTLDAMYYDTYAEDYKDLKEFFDEYVIALLDSDGLFGFYNGLGADRQVCYDVYTKVRTPPYEQELKSTALICFGRSWRFTSMTLVWM